MLVDAGCTHVILGHSERRTLFGETDVIVDRKAASAVKKGLIPILVSVRRSKKEKRV